MDITLCSGEGCPFRDRCFRARAVAYGRQDWFGRPPFSAQTKSCDSFMPLPAPSHGEVERKAYFLWQARQAAGQPGTPEGDYFAAKQMIQQRLDQQLTW